MEKTLSKRTETILLLCILFIDIVNIICDYSRGLNDPLPSIPSVLSFINFFALIIIFVSCIIVTIIKIIKKNRFVWFTFAYLLLGVCSFMPPDIFNSLGALTKIYIAGPDLVANDARQQLKQLSEMTCYGDENYNYRYLCQYLLPLEELPQSIQRVKPMVVTFDIDYVELQKVGGYGSFYIFPIDKDPFIDQPTFHYENKLNWELRISEGLYWSIHDHSIRAPDPLFMGLWERDIMFDQVRC
jgi:energy-coupling factor transporter transmembrane protein EcfT